MDRNGDAWVSLDSSGGSLSARRAWIEIILGVVRFSDITVALRKESVDRNAVHGQPDSVWQPSLSARRAWIEMSIK